MYKIKNFIDGKKISMSENFFDIYDPSTGEVQGSVVDSIEDFNKLIESSLNSFHKWSEYTPLKDLEFYQSINILEKIVMT